MSVKSEGASLTIGAVVVVDLLEAGRTCARVGLVAGETEVAAASVVAATAVPATYRGTTTTTGDDGNAQVVIDLLSPQQSTSHIFSDESGSVPCFLWCTST